MKTQNVLQSMEREISTHAQNILKTCCYSHVQSSRAVVPTGWSNFLQANDTTDMLQRMFGNNIIWPLRSPNVNALDCYLWGYLKEYINRPWNLEDLKNNIRRELRAISPATLRSVMNNALAKYRSCIAVEGQHLREITFCS